MWGGRVTPGAPARPHLSADACCVQVEDEMIQCVVCEDWLHGRVSLGHHTVPPLATVPL